MISGVEIVGFSVGFTIDILDREFKAVLWIADEGAVDEICCESCEESEDDCECCF